MGGGAADPHSAKLPPWAAALLLILLANQQSAAGSGLFTAVAGSA
jgi:hypothetical protein